MRKEFRSIELLRELTAALSAQYRTDRSGLQAQITDTLERHQRAESRLSEVLESRSWRITESLRRIATWIRSDPVARSDSLDGQRSNDKPTLNPPPDVVQSEQRIYRILERIPKDLFANLAQVQLDAFLSSGASLSFAEPDRPQISVLMVLFNRAELTLSCLRSLFAEKDTCYEIVIVDNASTDSTTRLLSRIHGVTILHNKENNHVPTWREPGRRSGTGKTPPDLEQRHRTVARNPECGIGDSGE